MIKKPLVPLFVLIGTLFIALAFMYWLTPAGSLPSYVPGYLSGSLTPHYKHGIAAFLLGLAAYAYAWFASGKK